MAGEAQLDRWHRRIVGVTVLLPLLAGLTWGVLSYRAEMQGARDTVRQGATLIAQYVEQLVQTQTVLQTAVRQSAQSSAGNGPSSAALHFLLAAVNSSQPYVHGIALIGFDGAMVASSRSFPSRANVGKREYLDAIAGGAELVVDRITLEPGKQDAFVIATPFKVADFDGVIVTAIDTSTVTDFLRSVATQTNEAASVSRIDGKLLVRSIPAPPMMIPANAPGRVALGPATQGFVRVVAVTDGVDRLYGYQRIENTPLVANFGIPMRGVWTNWLLGCIPVWCLLATLGFASYLSMERMERNFRHRLTEEIAAKRVQQAEELAEQRKQLMREMNHRVKNNLALVGSMINMKMRLEPGFGGAEIKARIAAISEVHDLMYRTDDGTSVDFADVLTRITQSEALVPAESGLTVVRDLDEGVMLGPELSTPLSLIAAELVTNSVKHAFQGRTGGTITLRLRREGPHGVLEIGDDGSGMAEPVTRRSGTAIIDALVRQVGGELTRLPGPGTVNRLRFTIPPRPDETA